MLILFFTLSRRIRLRNTKDGRGREGRPCSLYVTGHFDLTVNRYQSCNTDIVMLLLRGKEKYIAYYTASSLCAVGNVSYYFVYLALPFPSEVMCKELSWD